MAKELKIKPLSDRVVIKVVEETESTPGGIILPDSAREKPQKGEVLAVGPGKALDKGGREEMEVKIGDVVLYAKYGGTEIKVGDQEYKILSVRDILAIIEQ
ncbi:MAG TPA: co-chaperone GroES [Candidatus Gastranaerophilales bacterium]|nr:co-chaperone GroES [Candidatus Gastranaerophilales bacterium]